MIRIVLAIPLFLMGLLNVAHAMEEPACASSNFDVIFDSVLAGIDYTFHEDAQNFHITVSERDEMIVSERLFQTVRSREGFERHFCGKDVVVPTTACSSSTDEGVPPFSNFCSASTEGAISFARNIFGDIFEEQGFGEENFRIKEAQFADGKLCSRCFPSKASHTLEGFQNGVLSCFVNRDINDLKRAFLVQEFCLEPQDAEIGEAGLVGLIRDSVRVVQAGEKTAVRLELDFKRMYELCFPPHIEKSVHNRSVIFTLNKKHLLLHLKQLVLGETLLRYVRVGDDIYAEPCFLTEKLSSAKIPYLSFVIDRSGSLEASFDELKESLKRAIGDAWKKDPNAIISVMFFSTGLEPLGEFTRNDMMRLFRMIDEKKADGETKLLEALRTEVSRIRDKQLLNYYAVTMFLFTDGFNYVNGRHIKIGDSDLKPCVESACKDGKSFTAISLGFGGSCDNETLCSIASATRGKFFPFAKMEDFLDVLTEKVEFAGEKKKIAVLLKLRDEAIQQAYVTVPQNDYCITKSSIFLDEEMAGASFQPVPEKVANIAPREINRVRLSHAYFAARQMLAESTIPMNEITRFAEDCDESTAMIIGKFVEIINKRRTGYIDYKKALEQLEALQGIYLH